MTIINKKCWEPNFVKTKCKCKCCVAGENQVCALMPNFTETTFINPPQCTNTRVSAETQLVIILGTVVVQDYVASATSYAILSCNALTLGWIGPQGQYIIPVYLTPNITKSDDYVSITTVNSSISQTYITCTRKIRLFCFTNPASNFKATITNNRTTKVFSDNMGLLIGTQRISNARSEQIANPVGDSNLNVADKNYSTQIILNPGIYSIQLNIVASVNYNSDKEDNDIMSTSATPTIGLAIAYSLDTDTECYI